MTNRMRERTALFISSILCCSFVIAGPLDELRDALEKANPLIALIEQADKIKKNGRENSGAKENRGELVGQLPQHLDLAGGISTEMRHLVAVSALEFDFERLNSDTFVAGYGSSKDCAKASAARRHSSDFKEYAEAWRRRLLSEAEANSLIGRTITFDIDVKLGKYQESLGGFPVYRATIARTEIDHAYSTNGAGFPVAAVNLRPCRDFGRLDLLNLEISAVPVNAGLLARIPSTPDLRRAVEERHSSQINGSDNFILRVRMLIDGALMVNMNPVSPSRKVRNWATGSWHRQLMLFGQIQDVTVRNGRYGNARESIIGNYGPGSGTALVPMPDPLYSQLILLHALRLSPSLLESRETAWQIALLMECGTAQMFKRREEHLGDDSGYLNFFISRASRASRSLGTLTGRTIRRNLQKHSGPMYQKILLHPYDSKTGGFPSAAYIPDENILQFRCLKHSVNSGFSPMNQRFSSRMLTKLDISVGLAHPHVSNVNFIPVDNASYRSMVEMAFESPRNSVYQLDPAAFISQEAAFAYAGFTVERESVGEGLLLEGKATQIHIGAPSSDADVYIALFDNSPSPKWLRQE